MLKKTIQVRKSEKGQGFLELGLSLIFLLILLSAVIDLGWAFFTLIALRDSAQEAATVGSICPYIANPDANTNSFKTIYTRFKESASAPIDMNKIEPQRFLINIYPAGSANPSCTMTSTSYACPNGFTYDIGDSIKVTVTYQHDIMTPLVGAFIGNKNSYPLKVTATDTILALDCRITN